MPSLSVASLRTALLAAGLLLFTTGGGSRASAAAAEKQPDPLLPAPLEGPIPTLKEAQQRLAGEEKQPDPEVALLLKPPASGALRSVRLLSATLRENPELPRVYGREYGLALETDRGWFLLRHYGSRGRNGALEDSLGTPKCWLETTARIGGVEVVRCEVAYEATDRLYNGRDKPRSLETVQAQYVLFCGVGPSGIPHCTKSMALAYKRSYEGHPVPELEERDYKLNAVVAPDGIVVTLSPSRKRGYRDSEYHMLGKHRVRFP